MLEEVQGGVVILTQVQFRVIGFQGTFFGQFCCFVFLAYGNLHLGILLRSGCVLLGLGHVAVRLFLLHTRGNSEHLIVERRLSLRGTLLLTIPLVPLHGEHDGGSRILVDGRSQGDVSRFGVVRTILPATELPGQFLGIVSGVENLSRLLIYEDRFYIGSRNHLARFRVNEGRGRLSLCAVLCRVGVRHLVVDDFHRLAHHLADDVYRFAAQITEVRDGNDGQDDVAEQFSYVDIHELHPSFPDDSAGFDDKRLVHEVERDARHEDGNPDGEDSAVHEPLPETYLEDGVLMLVTAPFAVLLLFFLGQ